MGKIHIVDFTPWRNAAIGLFGRALEGQLRSILIAFILLIAAAGSVLFMVQVMDQIDKQSWVLRLPFLIAWSVTSLYIGMFFYVLFYRFALKRFFSLLLFGAKTVPVGIGIRCRLFRRNLPYFGIPVSELAVRLRRLRQQLEDTSARRMRRRRLLARWLRAACILVPVAAFIALAVIQETTEPVISGVPAAVVVIAAGLLMFVLSRGLAAAPVSLARHRRSLWLRTTGAIASSVGLLATLFAVGLFVWLFAGIYSGAMNLLGIDKTAIENSSFFTTVVSLALIGSFGWGFPKIADFFGRHVVDRGDRRLAEAKRQIMPDANEAMGADSRAPVLFLRSFADDKLQVDFGRLSPMEDPEKRSFEESLVANLSCYGPVIAIAEPGLPPVPGAARAYFKTHEWQPRVLDWMNRSRLIAIVVGQTRGIQWEVEKILAHRHIGKTMLLLPPSPRHRERWSVICQLLDDTPWRQIAMQMDTALLRAAYFAPDGQVVVFTSKKNREIDYRLAVQFAAYGLLLHERGV